MREVIDKMSKAAREQLLTRTKYRIEESMRNIDFRYDDEEDESLIDTNALTSLIYVDSILTTLIEVLENEPE